MKIQYINITFLFLILILSSCQRKMTLEEAYNYIQNPENGLTQEKLINGITYKVSFRPIFLVINQYQEAYDTLTEKGISVLKNQYGNYYSMLLSISYNNKEALKSIPDFQHFSSIMQEMGFGMDKHVFLTTNTRDTLQMADFNFARYFGMGKSNDILLVFNKNSNPAKTLTFRLNEFGLKTGDTRFIFNVKDLEKADKIRIKK